MRIQASLTAATLLGAALFLPGCLNGDNSPTGVDASSSDRQSIEYVVTDEQAAFIDPNVMVFDGSQDASSSSPIATNAWRRQLVSLDRTINIVINDPDSLPPTANVTVNADAKGLLHLWVRSPEDTLEFTKDWEDLGVRTALLTHREDDDNDADDDGEHDADRSGDASGLRNGGWHLVAVSGMLFQSPGTTRHIESVRIQAGDVDQTITNVSDLIRLENLLKLPPESDATVTVNTGDATDHVFLHLRHRQARIELTSNGDGTFTGHFRTGDVGGPRHMAVDVLSDGTLFDDTAAYDNVVWGIPFRVGLSPCS